MYSCWHCAASVGGSGLVFGVIVWEYQSKCISYSQTFIFFNSGKHNVACIFRGMGSITTLSQQTLITQSEFFNFALILFLLLKFTTHSILFIRPPSIATCLHYRSCCASCVILTQWNYDFLNLLWKWKFTGFTKLGVQRIREMLSFVLGFGLSCHFLFEKTQGEI